MLLQHSGVAVEVVILIKVYAVLIDYCHINHGKDGVTAGEDLPYFISVADLKKKKKKNGR